MDDLFGFRIAAVQNSSSHQASSLSNTKTHYTLVVSRSSVHSRDAQRPLPEKQLVAGKETPIPLNNKKVQTGDFEMSFAQKQDDYKHVDDK